MTSTYEIKKQQLANGAFKIGSGSEVVLIMGSCRSLPYINYLHEWNKITNRFTIYSIDPFNWNWNSKDERVDYMQVLKGLETDKEILRIISSTKIFIHEYYKNFGMFNTLNDGDINIYEFGMKPEIDICIPNFNDLFILFNDIVTFDPLAKTKAILDYEMNGKLSDETEKLIYNISQGNLEKFYGICRLSDVPEMEEYFKENFTKQRLFWTYNHIAKGFSLAIFKFINDKFLKLDLSEHFWSEISREDIYANNYTYLTEYDLKYYPYQFGEEIKLLNL